MKSGFKRAINWNKYHPKVIVEEQNRDLDFLINPSAQEVNIRFVWTFENNGGRTSYTRYYLPLVELKDFNIMNDGRNFFDQPVKDNLIKYDNNQKIATGQRDDDTTGSLLDDAYFKNYYKMKSIDLSKQQALDSDPKAKEKTNFTANLEWDGNTTIFFFTEVNETILDFSKGTVKGLWIYFTLI